MGFKIRIQDALTAREKDENGFLIIKDNPIAKAGVFDYLLSEVDSQSNSDDIVKVCRTFENLSKNKDLFKGKPIKLTHKWVGKNGDSEFADGAIISEVRASEPYLKADLIIYNPSLIKEIESGQIVEISPAYEAALIKKNGVYNGESFSYEQDLKSVNHLAIVESGRSGSDLRIQDSKGVLKMNFKEAFKIVMQKMQDSDIEKETQDSDLANQILSIASNNDLDNEAKIKAINELLAVKTQDNDSENESEKTQDSDTESKETQDNDNESEKDKEKTQDNDSDNEKIEVDLQELAEIVEKVTDSKFRKLQDSLNKETKRINDTYSEISRAIGTSFDYQGKSVSDLYRFGYEALTRTKLQDGLDSKTAFKLALAQKNPTIKAQDSKPATSELDSVFALYK